MRPARVVYRFSVEQVSVVTWLLVSLLTAVQLLGACSETVEVGRDDALSVSGGGADGSAGAGGGLNLGGVSNAAGDGAGAGMAGAGAGMAGAGVALCQPSECRGQFYACGNCEDDDLDGVVDAADPACVGPCDNDEAALGTGLKGNQSGACHKDCYFDGDSGAGNDQCSWSDACDPRSVAPDYPPSGEPRCEYTGGVAMGVDCDAAFSAQPVACVENCMPLAPNGCDCFGCCELPAGNGQFRFIGIGAGAEPGCALDALDDAARCPPCTPVPSCMNECSECEACVGRGVDPSCSGGVACPPGHKACSPQIGCASGQYCVTGCCVRVPQPF